MFTRSHGGDKKPWLCGNATTEIDAIGAADELSNAVHETTRSSFRPILNLSATTVWQDLMAQLGGRNL